MTYKRKTRKISSCNYESPVTVARALTYAPLTCAYLRPLSLDVCTYSS